MGRKSRTTSTKSSATSPSVNAGNITTVNESVTDTNTTVNFRSDVVITRDWVVYDVKRPFWLLTFMLVGGFFSFLVGTGGTFIFPNKSDGISPWRYDLADGIRATAVFQFFTFQGMFWDEWNERFSALVAKAEKSIEAEDYARNPSHPLVFAILREAVIREKGGYVHPDLGFLVPAPSGAARGLGMVRDSYHHCQIHCLPGLAEEKLHYKKTRRKAERTVKPKYHQEEVLLRIPLSAQMTRKEAIDTLAPLIPDDLKARANLHDLDDVVLLALFLAHERGIGRYSRYMPYIASLPLQPSCGYSKEVRPYMLDAIRAYRDEIGVDVRGWPQEIVKATDYAEKISTGLDSDFGPFINSPNGWTSLHNIEWALCQVASRATAGSEKHGLLRLVPILDLINHDAFAGEFIELAGTEKLRDGDFVDAEEEDSGTFVVRSLRHGRRKPLRKGQELMANYNVPHYSPLDWFVSLGFLPPERWGSWQKLEPALPRVRSDGPFAESAIPTAEIWKEKGQRVVERIRSAEL